MAGQLDEAAKQILGTLLVDFTERGLTARDLDKGYEGPLIVALATAVCNIDDINQVDFDVAFSDLEKKNFISTGPMEQLKSEPGTLFFVCMAVSKREYAYLTELGYKAARQPPNRPNHVNRVVNNVHISGGQFSNLQLATGEKISQEMRVTNADTQSEIVNRLISILEQQGQVLDIDQRSTIAAAVAAANEGDGKEAKSLMAKVCGSAWESAQPMMWSILGDLIKKSLGL
ncbi:hypothetical protein DP183_12250 [Enterobacter kobei]|uniref:Uncharacterized protein n=1 Tax=Enterobacter kobei TaxID=208224 RepID=A0ABX9F905_9ENTR|nr:hypothetical protein [Enterobacter kobei]RAY28979.1 hypothetical protein DP181_04315 [Enterobacter kobei]RAY36245.1 hypothetical protein DP183_12250 [Enterobacter kobei]